MTRSSKRVNISLQQHLHNLYVTLAQLSIEIAEGGGRRQGKRKKGGRWKEAAATAVEVETSQTARTRKTDKTTPGVKHCNFQSILDKLKEKVHKERAPFYLQKAVYLGLTEPFELNEKFPICKNVT